MNTKIQTCRQIQNEKKTTADSKSSPAVNHLRVLILKPPETLPQGQFGLALRRIHFIAGNPLLPLKLRVCKAPRLDNAFPCLKLHVLWNHLWFWLCVRSTVAPQIIRFRFTIVSLYLHHLPISERSCSVVILHWNWAMGIGEFVSPSLFKVWSFMR